MLRDFIAWLDDYLHGEGSPAIARAFVGIMSFAVLIGAVVGSLAVKAGALISVILLLISSSLILLSDRRRLRREVEKHEQLVSHYCKQVDELRPAYEIISWETVCTVSASGDGRSLIKIRVKVLSDNFWFMRLWEGCGWPQSSRHRRHVKLKARSILVGDTPGVSLKQTSSWGSDGRLDLIIHFSEPPKEGEVVSFVVENTWPGRCVPLMRDRSPDRFSFKFRQPAAHARYKVVLPAGQDAYVEPVGFRNNEENFQLSVDKDDDGRFVCTFEAFNPPTEQRIGFTLEVKERSAQAIKA